MELREFALEVVRKLRAAGFQSLWAGGCVRDELLGIAPHDYDVATDATPEQVRKLFRRSLAVGAQFGVVEVLGPEAGLHVQVATFRSDGTYLDGRHPDSVRYGTAEEDAQRRDFTINGLFCDPLNGQILDFVGGQEDLRAKCLRAIGDPAARFQEDKLRLLRAVRFAARFDLTMEAETRQAIERMAEQLPQVSAERITDELRKIAHLPERGRGYRELAALGLLAPALGPWFRAGSQFAVLSELAEPVPLPLALATLLLEMHQDELDAVLREWPLSQLASRLRLSNDERDETAWLVEHRDLLRQAERLPASKLKPLLAHPLREPLLNWLATRLRQAGEPTDCIHVCRQKLALWSPGDLDPVPLVTGDDLLKAGYPAGPRFKEWLARLRAAQLDGEIGNKAEGLRRVGEWLAETKKDA